jgi:hypothetical protein
MNHHNYNLLYYNFEKLKTKHKNIINHYIIYNSVELLSREIRDKNN